MLGEREPDMIELIRVEKTDLVFQKLNFDATVVPSNFSNCMNGHHIISMCFYHHIKMFLQLYQNVFTIEYKCFYRCIKINLG